jgi:hypothetical protein
MKKKFKVLVPVVGYVCHEVWAEDAESAQEIGYEERVGCGEFGDLHPATKITVEKNKQPMVIEVTEIDLT